MKYILFVLVSLSFFGCNQTISHQPTDNTNTDKPVPTSQEIKTETPPKETLAIEATKIQTPDETFKPRFRGEDSPLSFHSFMKQKFEGSNFTLGKKLEDFETHESFFATYTSNKLTISGTIHIPKGKGKYPLLILNHGYFPPETYTNGYGFGREQKYFAQNGYVAFHIDYRGYALSDKDPEALGGRRLGYLGYSADAINAVYALKEANLPQIDTSRIGFFGHSMGGGVALNAITAQPDLVQAAVIWGSVSGDYQKNFEQWTRNNFDSQNQEIFETHFGSLDDPLSFKALSSQNYFERIKTPISLHHGTLDEDVPIEWSQETVSILESLNKDFEYFEYESAPHVFWNQYWDTAIENTRIFFDKHLKNL